MWTAANKERKLDHWRLVYTTVQIHPLHEAKPLQEEQHFSKTDTEKKQANIMKL